MMKFQIKYISITLVVLLLFPQQNIMAQGKPSAEKILSSIDNNMFTRTINYTAKMLIHTKNRTDEKIMRSWGEGREKGFTEFLSPARDKGTKYLKLDDDLWMYLPNIEKVIKISGHLLRQSMMGSDFSYEDSMERGKLLEDYDSEIVGEEVIAGIDCYILELIATRKDVTYYRQKIWVDKDRYVMMQSERYAKTGKLLKVMTVNRVEKFEDRFYPVHMTMTDKLKKNSSTEFIMESVEFDVRIPASIFSRRNLSKK